MKNLLFLILTIFLLLFAFSSCDNSEQPGENENPSEEIDKLLKKIERQCIAVDQRFWKCLYGHFLKEFLGVKVGAFIFYQ